LAAPASRLLQEEKAGYIYLRILTCLLLLQNSGAGFAKTDS
jgi:hypothetical protein